MTSRDFAYWLQGYFEIHGPGMLSSPQVEVIQKHLSLVFVHEIDPSAGDQAHQDVLNAIHHNPAPATPYPDLTMIPAKPNPLHPAETVFRC